MNKVFVDKNIVIDLLTNRPGYYEAAAQLFSLSDKQELKLVISALTVANTNYILSKQKSAKDAREILRKFKVLTEVASLDDKIIELALSDEAFADFEDGLQYYSALANNVHAILTRNKKDFKSSKLPVLTAAEYLARK